MSILVFTIEIVVNVVVYYDLYGFYQKLESICEDIKSVQLSNAHYSYYTSGFAHSINNFF